MKNTETGRSMVEMLGVLAIIGVLSVAGIAGYTMAMRKARANDLASFAAQCGILARAYSNGSGTTTATSCATLGTDSLADAGLSSYLSDATGATNAANTSATVTLTFTASQDGLCTEVRRLAGNTTACTTAAGQTAVFTFAD